MNNQAAQTMPEFPAVQRCKYVGGSYPMRDDPAGDYVDYEDHVAIMESYGRACYEAGLSQAARKVGGYALVPMEPTRAMVNAGWTSCERMGDTYVVRDLTAAYSAMLAAAPATQQNAPRYGRYFADGPQGHFFADDLKLARDLVNLYDKNDDWTITDLHNPTGAAPAASGGESHPDALPDGTLSKSTVKRVTALAAASVSERARELLAHELEHGGFPEAAYAVRNGYVPQQAPALRALEQALTQQRGSEPCLYVKPRLVEILHKLGPAQTEHRVMVSTVPDAQYTVCLTTTPQPGAEALRGGIRNVISRIINDGRDREWVIRELESLLGRGAP